MTADNQATTGDDKHFVTDFAGAHTHDLEINNTVTIG